MVGFGFIWVLENGFRSVLEVLLVFFFGSFWSYFCCLLFGYCFVYIFWCLGSIFWGFCRCGRLVFGGVDSRRFWRFTWF